MPLPVDSHIELLRAALDRHRAAVLTAAPGAGKTTRVPPALIDRGRVLLLQPRRVAARAIARRIAEERSWTIGRTIGWHIRFDRRFTRETRLLVVTEGILTAYLQDDPLLSDVTTVILDEFHERSIHADLGLALVKQAWQARDDLRLLVMSATLDTSSVSAYLSQCPVIDVPGTLHPTQVDYAPGQTVAQALRELLPATTGNVLCFLPGAREIANARVEAHGMAADVELVALHGSLDAQEQDAALRPGGRRRVVFSTNIAETSLTVPGVSVVIDTGLQKVARYDDERGVDSLVTERITADSADQRAGRAARLGPGVVRRLWDARDRLRPHREPEVGRIDLSGPVLSILASGSSLDAFEWFDRPDPARLASAVTLLKRLGAVDVSFSTITQDGRWLRRFPLHPRLAVVMLHAGGAFEACAVCAWLSEGMRLDQANPTTTCDLLPVLDNWPRMPQHVRQVAEQLDQLARTMFGDAFQRQISELELRRALLAGYPDRVAKRRTGDKVTMANGHGAVIGRESGVRNADWIVAIDVTSGRSGAITEGIVQLASSIEPAWLEPTFADVNYELDRATGEVKGFERQWYHELVLAERTIRPDDEARTKVLVEAWLAAEPDAASGRLLRRLAFAGIAIDVAAIVQVVAERARTLAQLTLTEGDLPWDVQQRLRTQAPERVTVPSGREHAIAYDADGGVSVSVKLQELFGLAETPLLGPQRTPLTFHLLAPSGRPVQTTRDLESFWERTYPEVRRELRGRYPKHPWPEDPWQATPTHKTKRR